MKLKSIILGLVAFGLIACFQPVLAQDNVASGSGVSRTLGTFRWQQTRLATTVTNVTAYTNLVVSGKGILRSLVFVPTAATSNLVYEAHDASARTGATAANEILVYAPPVTTLLLAGTGVSAIPSTQPEGIPFSNGLVIVFKPLLTMTDNVTRAFIQYDVAR